MNNIKYLLEGRVDNENGVFHVEYEEFKNLYQYLSRVVARNQKEVQMLLFTLSANERTAYAMVSDEAMDALEVSVIASLRMVDVGTRYSSVQYMVILFDTNEANGKKVASRVIKKFYRTYLCGDVDIRYDIQTLQPKIM